jgi:hypothetical protein
MRPLNAIDAIAPAFTRTHETLFKPFRLGRSWKLSASNYLAVCGAMFIPFPLLFAFLPKVGHDAMSRGFFVVIVTFYSVFMMLAFYFGGRMELVAFEMLVTRAKFVAPMWRRYGSRTGPWLGQKALVGTVWTLVVCGVAFVPLSRAVALWSAQMLTAGTPHTAPDPAAMQALINNMLGMESVFFLVFFLLKVPSTLLNDFVLPFYVLEDMSLMTAVQRGFDVFVGDPLHVLLYLVLKPILFIIGAIMMEIAIFVCMIPLGIVAVILAVLVGVTAGHNSALGALLLIPGMILFYGFVLWLTFGVFGYLVTLLEAYGIYFLGGRYPLLGNLLEPGPGAPFAPPPSFPSREERADDDGGPPMPMNPAVV